MSIVTIDFETYYDKEYSLSKMTTEAYIRDPRFEVIGVGVKVDNHPTDWYSGSNPGAFLKGLDYSKHMILCHNTAFDGAILSWHYGIKPKLWLDTLSMARPRHSLTVGGSLKSLASYYGLGAKGTEVENAIGKRRADFTDAELARYGEYCCNDVELTYQLFQKLKRGFSSTEIMVIDQILRMFIEPTIELDVSLLHQHLSDVVAERERALESVATIIPDADGDVDKILNSNPKLAGLLTVFGVSVPMKLSARTGEWTWAFSKTDQGFLDLLEYPDPRVQAIVAARLGVRSTIEETRTQSLIEVASRGCLPILLNYYGANKTGRLSGGDKLNLQNLPARKNNTIRRALRAPKGHVLIPCDSAQIEARIVAWLAGQDDLLDSFRHGRDVYSEFATEVFGKKITKADVAERFVGKTCILGLGYGMGAPKFQSTLKLGQGDTNMVLPQSEAIRIVMLYRNKYHKIYALWRQCDYMLRLMSSGYAGVLQDKFDFDVDGLVLPNGFRIQYPGLRAATDGYFYISDPKQYRKYAASLVTGTPFNDSDWTKIYGGKVTENIVQALAALVIREQMVECAKHGLKLVLQVHDEIVAVAKESEAEEAMATMVRIMSTPPDWAPDLPLACEAGYADNYGDA